MSNKTIDYYNQKAEDFAASTVSVDFKETQNRFLEKLHTGDYILDFGCGSGRDTKAFLEAGMHVEAIDGSEKLCQIASKYTGISVKNMLFQELDECQKYDGIWACSSILHLSKKELELVFEKMGKALKSGGYIYTSFKYGIFEGERNGRYFIDFTIEKFEKFIEKNSFLVIEEYWLSKDVRPGRGEEKWLNLILRRK